MKNISISIIRLSTSRASAYAALITWIPQNTTRYQPSSYRVECINDQHQIKMLVNNETFSIEIVGLLPSTSYNCCVSAVHGSYTIRRVCIETTTIDIPLKINGKYNWWSTWIYHCHFSHFAGCVSGCTCVLVTTKILQRHTPKTKTVSHHMIANTNVILKVRYIAT